MLYVTCVDLDHQTTDYQLKGGDIGASIEKTKQFVMNSTLYSNQIPLSLLMEIRLTLLTPFCQNRPNNILL